MDVTIIEIFTEKREVREGSLSTFMVCSKSRGKERELLEAGISMQLTGSFRYAQLL
jgi:hypothetical protein